MFGGNNIVRISLEFLSVSKFPNALLEHVMGDNQNKEEACKKKNWTYNNF
jgi:hypothetical protein